MITVVCSIKKPKQFIYRLGKSLLNQDVPYELILTSPDLSLPDSYNSIGQIKKTDFVMFAHQDVWFGNTFLKDMERIVRKLPEFGVGGVIGWELGSKESIGGVWRTKRGWDKFDNKEFTKADGQRIPYKVTRRGFVVKEPTRVLVIDDMIFLVRKGLWNRQKFDSSFHFHGMGEDYCLQAKEEGRRVYVLPLVVSTIPTGARTEEKYGEIGEARRILGRKWWKKYGNFYTCIGEVRCPDPPKKRIYKNLPPGGKKK